VNEFYDDLEKGMNIQKFFEKHVNTENTFLLVLHSLQYYKSTQQPQRIVWDIKKYSKTSNDTKHGAYPMNQ
jgi:hypothetical protein